MKCIRSHIAVCCLFICLTASPLSAQTNWKYTGKKFPGYVITRKNEVIQGRLQIQNAYDNQYSVLLLGEGSKKKKLVAFEVKEYGFMPSGTDTIRYIRLKWQGNYVLLNLEKKGYVQLFGFYSSNSGDDSPSQITEATLQHQWILQKENVYPTSFEWGRFYEQAAEFFEDNEKLSDDIWAKKYKRDQLPAIIDRYNEWIKTEKK